MSKDRLIEIYNHINKNPRKLSEERWKEKQSLMNSEWEGLRQRRHDFIRMYREFSGLDKDVDNVENSIAEEVAKKINVPTFKISQYNETHYPNIINSTDTATLLHLKNASDAIKIAEIGVKRTNSLYGYSNSIANNIGGQYGAIISPYESQILFETTGLGYQGVMMPILNAFSTTLGLLSRNLSFRDIEGIKRYLVEMDFMNQVRMAVIDAQVYGGGVLTPIWSVRGEPLYLSDLKWDLTDFFGADNFKLESLMCFDRFCIVPHAQNDGLFVAKFWSGLPIKLQTIFENGVLDGRWLAKFSSATTSRSKFFRPDTFGLSIFARAKQAVYNYEQQLQFLNYALGQLSIVVFNSKSQDYLQGGNADTGWNSALGGNQLNDIKSQLSAMQEGMNVERGLYLNDIEVSALNRSFQGVADIVMAMEKNASLAFGVRQDMLFGVVKSSLGYKEESERTPEVVQQREIFRTPITQVLKWGVLGYFAKNKWQKQNENGKVTKWDKNDFIKMLDSVGIFYNDMVRTNEDILKESGAMDIMKLVEARLISMQGAISFLSDIPILNKSYDTSDESQKKWRESVVNLQNVGIGADTIEQTAITKINQAIIDKDNALSPTTNIKINKLEKLEDVIEKEGGNLEPKEVQSGDSNKNETPTTSNNCAENDNLMDKLQNLLYNNQDATQKSLADFGEVDAWGIVNPRSPESRRTKKEVTQRTRKLKSHEG